MKRVALAAALLFVLSTSPARAQFNEESKEGPVAVPDGGSTLMLLGGALAATGALIARYRR